MTSTAPVPTLESRSRSQLAALAREYQMLGHLIDRVALPQVLGRGGADVMEAVSIDEWSAASPVYTRRMRGAMGIEGSDVAAIFKALQLDVGAPHQYMDFRFRVDAPDYGEFWLDHCGALVDVEPMGDEMTTLMCHHIEDPTFDATANATNPLARVRPIHRPPRQPADRHPHCHWKVHIEHGGDPVPPAALEAVVASSRLAGLELLDAHGAADDGGRDDYAGDLDPDFAFEDLSHRALVVACKEFAIQVHLLVRAYLLAVTERFGEEAARACGLAQFVGSAWISSERLVRLLGVGRGVDAVVDVVALHPALQPVEYTGLRVERVDGDRARITLAPLDEDDPHSWFGLLDPASPVGLEAVVHAVEPRAVVSNVASGDAPVWEVDVRSGADPATEPEAVSLGRISTAADFAFVAPPRRKSRVT